MSTASFMPTLPAISSRKYVNSEPAGPLPTTAIRDPSSRARSASPPVCLPGSIAIAAATRASLLGVLGARMPTGKVRWQVTLVPLGRKSLPPPGTSARGIGSGVEGGGGGKGWGCQGHDHPAEDHRVDRKQDVPVRESGDPPRLEERRLDQRRPRRRRLHLVLEPGAPGDAHLGAQSEQFRPSDRLDTPEIKRVPDTQAEGVPSAEPHSDPAHRPVREAADPPQDVGKRPPVSTANPLHLREDNVPRNADRLRPAVHEHPLTELE